MAKLDKLDIQLEFNEEAHTYTYNGHVFSCSVTEFVHKKFPAFNTDEVINNILNSRKMNDPNYEYYGMSKEDIKRHWKKGSDLGTIMHAQIEDYYNSGRTKLPEVITQEFGYFLNFDRDNSTLDPFRMEQRIFSVELDIAGSIDLLVRNPNNTFSIIDWKRAKNMDLSQEVTRFTKFGLLPGISHITSTNYNHYCFQLNVYRYILETEYNMRIVSMKLVVLHPNNKSGNYEIHDVPFMDNEMEYIMDLRRKEVATKK